MHIACTLHHSCTRPQIEDDYKKHKKSATSKVKRIEECLNQLQVWLTPATSAPGLRNMALRLLLAPANAALAQDAHEVMEERVITASSQVSV